VSGGTSGIGAAVALLLAREGARVAVLGRREAEGLAVAARLAAASPGPHGFVACDVRAPEACAAAVARAAALLGGGIDVLVCAAGVVLAGTAEEATEEDWALTFETNVSGTWRLCKYALPFLCRRSGAGAAAPGAAAGDGGNGAASIAASGGVIVTVASDWALVGASGAAAYCASKGAVVQLTRCLALEHAKDGVRANALCPGDTFVERWARQGYFAGGRGGGASGPVSLAAAQADARHGGVPLARVASADEIARAALFLASDDSSFMTGQTLVVDGGNTAR
jgi:meso-butanediol dehydrogenase/(S,S)-butanediol dehydrogenase/diacetyl reductase